MFHQRSSHRWFSWLPLYELWYNTNWHSSTGRTPFELVYGHPTHYFGIAPVDAVSNSDAQQWLRDRHVVMESVKQHLLRTQQRMKVQADKHRTERCFEVGDTVFLKMQPYIQSSIAPRANHKLAFKYFGPFEILARVGAVAYKLKLPDNCRVHSVFHVSLLKRQVKSDQQVLPVLPSTTAHLQVPACFLDRRLLSRGNKTVAQVLVKWSHSPVSSAMWEDQDMLKQQFQRAPAWGQAVFSQGDCQQRARGNSDNA